MFFSIFRDPVVCWMLDGMAGFRRGECSGYKGYTAPLRAKALVSATESARAGFFLVGWSGKFWAGRRFLPPI